MSNTIVLALDTSTPACSVALQVGDTVFEDHRMAERSHTRLLMPIIQSLLKVAGINAKQIERVVIGNGPGSFVGMRIGASVAQGLSHSVEAPIQPVSSLAAIAVQVFEETTTDQVLVLQDARMQQLYLGHFRRCSDTLAEALCDETIVEHEAVPEMNEPFTGAGGGWDLYPVIAAGFAGYLTEVVSVIHPRAKYLLKLAEKVPFPLQRPQDLQPAYLRHQVATVTKSL